MELVDFQGLNCYTNSLITVAHAFGLDYCRAFWNLWSESAFSYKSFRKGSISARLLQNLESMGIEIRPIFCRTPSEAKEGLAGAALARGDFVVVEMDAYHTPWSPFYGLFTGSHCFICKYSDGGSMLCYDPTYGKADEAMEKASLFEHCAKMWALRRVGPDRLSPDAMGAVRTFVLEGGNALERLFGWPDGKGEESGYVQASKYVDCLISCRYLFRRYLEEQAPSLLERLPLKGEGLYHDWIAVKFAFIKAAYSRKSALIAKEAKEAAAAAMRAEWEAAAKLCGEGGAWAMPRLPE